ncbi:UNVERIFIED_CONTAM: hypothetical protein GTU68_015309 [Idotea baltica]|nr:hypothetical protein [Idotea baltica]
MKFSEQWLRSLVNPKVSCQELIDRLSMAGLEVDGTEPVSGFFSGVVIGEVLSIEEHPDAKKLKICQVSTGSAIFQVVCGAINVRAGLKTAFAMVDACLPGELTIKSAKLRGIESFGMLCSASELGLSAETDGLLELPENVKAGEDLFNYFSLNDVSIDVDLTPNRGDCLSLMGLAREIGALYNEPVSFPEISPAFVSHQQEQVVSVEAKESCPRYVGRLLINIDSSQPTPLWLSERLRRSGLKSINSVVDVLNYVMIELGQPLHAFDQQKMQGDLVVRMAQPTESLTLLTGQHIKLTDMTLVIADQKQVLAIAGVMGGADSSVTNKTENIFIESAFFNPVSLAGTARSYGLHTDSAHRFERGVDWKLQRKALDRATQLLQDIVGGEAGPNS